MLTPKYSGYILIYLNRVTRHLRPLAIAANIVQAAFCRIDQVLLTFGFLTMTYSNLTETEDAEGCNAIMASIEKRWAKADQEIFICSLILNPFIQTKAFGPLEFLTNAGIQGMIGKLWKRVFKSDTSPDELHLQLREYLDHTGMFKTLEHECLIEANQSERQVRKL